LEIINIKKKLAANGAQRKERMACKERRVSEKRNEIGKYYI
jgi:hypothetical protein